jgi:SulP family sulfate permease
VLIAFSQLPGLLGMDADRAGNLLGAGRALLDAGAPDAATTLLGVAALLGFLFGERLMRRVALLFRLTGTPRLAFLKTTQLAVIFLATLLAVWLLPSVDRVPNPDAGLPRLVVPLVSVGVWAQLLLPSLVIAVVVFVTGTAVAKSISSRRRKALDTSREALAIGAANLATGLTGGYATGVSLSRSALVDDAGAVSPLSSAIGGLIVVPVSLFGGAILALLPKAALAALVISAVVGLVKLREIRAVLHHSRSEAVVIAVTFLATLALGVQWGLLAGALAGIAQFLWASSLPRVTREGEDPETGLFRSVERDDVRSDNGPILVIRIDRPLYFGNVGHAEDRVSQIVADHPEAEVLVLDMRAVTDVDATGLRMLTRLLDNIEERDLRVIFASLQRPVRAALDGQKHIDRCAHFDTVPEAVRMAREGQA